MRKTPPFYTPSPEGKADQTSLTLTTRKITLSTVLRNQVFSHSDNSTHPIMGLDTASTAKPLEKHR